MIKIEEKPGTYNNVRIIWTNPVCGHVQEWTGIIPAICQNPECNQANEDQSKLRHQYNQDWRVSYYIHSKL